jgi:hypothetical protein
MNGTLEWYRPDGRSSVDAIAKTLAVFFLRGAGARVRG